MERLIESTSIVERNAQSLGTRWRSIPLLALLLLPASPGLPLAGCGEQTGPEQAAAPLPGSGELAVLRQAISPGWYVTWPDEDPRDGKPDDKEPPGWFNGDEKILVVLVLEENCVSEMTVRFGEDLCGDVRATMTREGGYFVWSAQCSVSGKTSFHQNWAIPVRYTGTLQCPVGPTTHPALANVDNPGPIITSANYTLTGGRSPYPTGCTSGTSCYFTTGDAITASWNAAADGNVICPEPPQRNPGGCIENVKFDFGSFGGGLVTVESAVNGVFSTTYRVAADGYYRGRVRLYAYKAYSGYSANRSSSYTHYDTKVTTINPKFFTITGGTGTNKAFKKDDIITITWNDGPNGNNNGDDYYYKLVNLSAIGGSASKTLTALGDGIFQTTHTITAGAVDLAQANLTVTIMDHGGHGAENLSLGPIGSFKVGSGAPWGQAAAMSCLDACAAIYPGAEAYACSTTAGALNYLAFLDGWGNTQYCSGSGAAESYVKPASGAPYNCGSNGCSYSAYVQDHAECSSSTNNCWRRLTVDNQVPTVTTARITLTGGSGPAGTFNAADRVTVTWDSPADGNSDIALAQGLPGNLGGEPFALARQADGRYMNAFIPSVPTDTAATSFTVAATDDAGNSASAATPGFALDNIVPGGTAAQVTFVSPPAKYKVGDTVTVRWSNDVLQNPDLISVRVDFAAIGRGLVDAAKLAGTEQWEASTTVPEGGTAAATFSVTVRPRDDAWNEGSIVSGTRSIDARSPVVIAAAITVKNMTQDGRFPLRIGDNVRVEWDTTVLPGGTDPAINEDVSTVNLYCPEMNINGAKMSKSGTLRYYQLNGLLATGSDTANGSCRVEAFDVVGNKGEATKSGVNVDLRRPTVSQAAIQVSGASGDNATLKIGDTMAVSWDAVGDGNSDVTRVWIDFTALGGQKVQVAGAGPLWRSSWSVPNGSIDTTGGTVLLTAEDDAGNSLVQSSLAFRFDNQPPYVAPDRPLVLAGSAGQPVKAGHRLTLTWTMGIAGYYPGNTDIAYLRGSFSAFGGGLVQASPAPQVYDLVLALDPVPEGTSDSAAATVTGIVIRDDAGNEINPTTGSLSVDNWPPVVRSQDITLSGDADGNGVYKVGETLTVRWNSRGPGGGANADLSTVVVVASPLGQQTVQPDANGIYQASFGPITAGQEDAANLPIEVRATDDAGYQRTATTSYSLDRKLPGVSQSSFRVLRADGNHCQANPVCSFKVGDSLQATYNPALENTAPYDFTRVRFDFSSVGGGPVDASWNGSIYAASYTVVAGDKDSSASLGIAITDDGGNVASGTTVSFTIDNQPPTVAQANIQIAGAGGDSRFVPGETVTATWSPPASGGAQPNPPNHDIATVVINLADFGCVAPPVTRAGNSWSASCLIPEGVAGNQAARAVVTATDDGGNAATGSSAGWPVDGAGPKVSTQYITVANESRGGQPFRPGDVALVSWDNSATGDRNADVVAVSVDFTQLGAAAGSMVAASQSPAGSQKWVARYTVVAGSIDTTGAVARVWAYDSHVPPLSGSGVSLPQRVDNQLPVVNPASMSFSGATGTPAGTFIVGNTLTIDWNNAGVNPDVQTVEFDFTGCGGPALVVGQPVAGQPGVYRGSFVVAAGSLDTDDPAVQPRVSVKVTDDVGNATSALSNAVKLDNKPPVISAAKIQVLGASGSGGTFIVGDAPKVTWNNQAAPGGDGNSDTLSSVAADLTNLGGVNPVALADQGGGCDGTAGDKLYSGGCTALVEKPLESGNASVKVVVTDNASNKAEATVVGLKVDLIKPAITALPDFAGNEGADVSFSATVQGASSYKWTFGDGTPPSSAQGPKHAYADNGAYVVTLEVADAAGNKATRSSTATIANVGPTVTGSNKEVNEGSELAAVLVATFTDPGSIDTHTATIDWGDGQSGPGTVDAAQNPRQVKGTHTYGADGSYSATVTVTDKDGGTGLGRFTVTVRNVAPTVSQLKGNGLDAPVIDEGGTLQLAGVASDPGSDDGPERLTWRWAFGDGATAEGRPLAETSHLYAADGQYTVTLTVVDSDGATGTKTLPVVVRNVAPTLQPLEPKSGNEGAPITLSASASDPGDPVLSYRWDLDLSFDSNGDGNPGNDQDLVGQTVQAIYADSRAQPYQIAVLVVDDDGLTDRKTTTVTVANVAPTAVLQLPASLPEGTVVNGVCQPTVLEASATLSDPGTVDTARGFAVTWDFGDGTAPLVQQGVASPARATHTFGDDVLAGGASPFTVLVTVKDKDEGSSSAEKQVAVTNVAPFALAGVRVGESIITGSYSTPEAREIVLTGSRSCDPGRVDGPALRYGWDFGDGSPAAQGAEVLHAFRIGPDEQNSYTVTLTVTDPQGASSQSTLQIRVDEQIPIPRLWVDLEQGAQEGVPLVFSGSVVNEVPDEVYTYLWRWGDDSADGEGETVEHAFPDNGIYQVILGAVNSHGTVGWAEPVAIEVGNAPPAVSIVRESHGEVGEGEVVALRAEVEDPGVADTHTYRWDCDGDPETVEGDQARVECPTSQQGTLHVALLVTDDDGASGEAALDVEVVNRPPVALPPENRLNVPEGTVVTLVGGGRDPGREDQLSYTWFLPGGGSFQGQTLQYAVLDEGQLTIELQVTDDGDPPLSSERAATLIFAVNLPPVAAICGNELDPAGLDPTAPPEDCRQEDVQGLEGEPLSFTALASDPGAGDRLTYSWSFTEEPREWEAAEDPENPHISHTFPADGTYPVSLRVEDGDGGEAQVQLVVTIGNRPPAVASFPDVQGEEGKVVQLRAEASDPGDDRLGYSWDFGDGQTTTTVEPVVEHVFADSGSYTVRLTVSDDGGGVTETSAEAVIANRPPSAAIVNPPLVALEGDELSFSGDGSDPSPSDNRGLAYLWDFGDGSEPREGRVVNHVFVDEGSGRFEVTLTVTDPDGATATAKTGVLVSNVRPTLGDMPDLQAEEGIPIVFTAPVSDPGSADQMTFTWNVGEAAAVERREPTLSWTFTDDRAQPFLVRVEVDDGDGGTDRTSFQVTVTNRPPRFVADPPPPAVAQQGQPYGYELSAVDEGADVLTFHLDASPAGMTLSPQGAGKAQLSWTPALDQIDLPFSVSVRVDDGDGGEDVLSWVVQVEGFVDGDGDRLPDSYEQLPANDCLDPRRGDAAQDPDGDGLTTTQEFQRDVSGERSSPCRSNAPVAPAVHSPARDAEVATATPELVVVNAGDPDDGVQYEVLGDLVPHGYQFEIGRELGTAAAEVVAGNQPGVDEGGDAGGEAAGEGDEVGELWDLCALLTPAGEEGLTAWTVSAGVLQENESYQWRVRSCDGWAFGPWMEAAGLKVDAVQEPPGTPALLAPAEGEAVSTPSPLIVIGNTSDPDGDALAYRVEIWQDRGSVDGEDGLLHASDPPIPAAAGPTTEYDLAGAEVALADDTQPCARAQAVDATGLPGPYSALRCFRVNADNQAPDAPALVRPPTIALQLPERWIGGEHVTEVASPQVELVFTGASDPDGEGPLAHLLELDAVPTFDSPARQASPDPSSGSAGAPIVAEGEEAGITPPGALPENTLHWWRVRAWDGQVWGEPALGLFFVNETNEAPFVPVPVSPAADQAVAEERPQLVVNDPAEADPDHDRVVYELAVAQDVEFGQAVAEGEVAGGETGTVTWQPEEPLPGGQLFWRVRARDDSGLTSEWSTPIAFVRTVDDACAALPAPVPQAPVGDAVLPPASKPLLVVQNVVGACAGQAIAYEFQLYLVGEGGQETPVLGEPAVVDEGAEGTTTFQVPVALGEAKKQLAYRWNARARLASGNVVSPWSDSARFQVQRGWSKGAEGESIKSSGGLCAVGSAAQALGSLAMLLLLVPGLAVLRRRRCPR